MPIFLMITLIIIVWIRYEKNKSGKIGENKSKDFWARETEADATRKKDISKLQYIEFPLDKLPFGETDNEEIRLVQKQLLKLTDKKMVNLSGFSNTDLKLEYGAPNLPHLSEYDHNFTLFTRNLYKWACLLSEEGDTPTVKSILSVGIECGTDISGNYTMLASIYAQEGRPEDILSLIAAAENIKTVMKDSTIRDLRNMLSSCYANMTI